MVSYWACISYLCVICFRCILWLYNLVLFVLKLRSEWLVNGEPGGSLPSERGDRVWAETSSKRPNIWWQRFWTNSHRHAMELWFHRDGFVFFSIFVCQFFFSTQIPRSIPARAYPPWPTEIQYNRKEAKWRNLYPKPFQGPRTIIRMRMHSRPRP